jgi:hypothetical protein
MPGSEPLLINVKTRLFVPVGGGRDEARRWAQDDLIFRVDETGEFVREDLCQRHQIEKSIIMIKFVIDVQNKPGNSSVPGLLHHACPTRPACLLVAGRSLRKSPSL